VSLDDDYGPSHVDTSTERIIRIPEAEEPPAAPAPPRPRRARPPILTRSSTPWIVALALFLVAAFSLVLIVLAPRDATAPSTTPAASTATDASGGAQAPLLPNALALPVPDDLRTHTVNAGGDNDLLAMSQSGVGALSSLEGAPVTADGPTVGTVFSDTVFSVTSPSGGELVVLVPYARPSQGPLALSEGETVVFNGTLMPVPDDLSEFTGSEAAAVAARSGSYIVAIPENVLVVPTGDGTPVN
jgi:hypothetical protein